MATAEQSHLAWRKLVPYLYDWFACHSLSWPSLACRWGPVLEQGAHSNKQRLYLSEQTDGSEPNRIVLVSVDVLHARTAAAEHLQGFAEHTASPHVGKPLKTLVHPGEVNRMRELPQHPHVLVTHTDSPSLYVWNTDTQPDRTGVKSTSPKQQSVADLVLEGHKQNAEFALAISNAAPLVASGGKDAKVLVWDLSSHISTSLAAAKGGRDSTPGAGTKLKPLHTLLGHSATIEDVCWCPGSSAELASVGDDFSLLLWDLRRGGAPVLHVASAHGEQDVHCVAWSPHREEMLVTGAADGSLKVWDRRKTASPLFAFHYHSQAVTVVEWCPQRPGVFASAGEDRLLCVWDLEARGGDAEQAAKRQRSAIPPQMLFQHAGHRAPVVDFQWNPSDPWTFFSVADEAGEGGGGTLQLWRVSDMVHRPEDEVLAELEQYREYIITGNEAALQKRPAEPAQQPAGAAGSGDRTGATDAAEGGVAAS
ncbi:hypothetical protein D9Q98_006144 [Chlorella vulgaris]|uniref:Histone-binding protein RBBP4-like N-terminal domain-containing protein n=1 Tax=Chlorella vulgaris TaxID=3077 RepID=A0A9D4TX68_CHLVU|nr:hypothetical protein D9Q98_006144 [Chlorella vulgaris]